MLQRVKDAQSIKNEISCSFRGSLKTVVDCLTQVSDSIMNWDVDKFSNFISTEKLKEQINILGGSYADRNQREWLLKRHRDSPAMCPFS